MGKNSFQPPKGMRDYYPAEMLRRRFIEKAWRDTSLRHGFDEIEGPLFEYTDLYTVKSGEGILSEIFGVFSGKDEQQVADAAEGRAPFALRPEFTPSLARMYAARAAQLGKPTKWFMAGPFFRAERPQRGRLREFLQWNIDFIGAAGSQAAGSDDASAADAETIACCIDLLASLGLTPRDIKVSVNDRRLVADLLTEIEVPLDRHGASMSILDKSDRMSEAEAQAAAAAQGLDRDMVMHFRAAAEKYLQLSEVRRSLGEQLERMPGLQALIRLYETLQETGYGDWLVPDPLIVRGLAYYTGMVFEVHEVSGAERAIAGGGRYDNLIELFGGPPTPAVGFGMGDVVLSLMLEDRKLMPQGAELLDRLSSGHAPVRPDIFIVSSGAETDGQVGVLAAELRRAGLHARRSYKATKNIGKLLKEASDSHARYAAILEPGGEVTLKHLAGGTQERVAAGEIAGRIARRATEA